METYYTEDNHEIDADIVCAVTQAEFDAVNALLKARQACSDLGINPDSVDEDTEWVIERTWREKLKVAGTVIGKTVKSTLLLSALLSFGYVRFAPDHFVNTVSTSFEQLNK